MVGLTTVEEEMSPCLFPLTLTAAEVCFCVCVCVFSLKKSLHTDKARTSIQTLSLANKKYAFQGRRARTFSELPISHLVHSFSVGMKPLA